ncbi:MAG: sensor histidine kinase [Leadbetterella sp.]
MKQHLSEIKWQSAVFGLYGGMGLFQAYFEHPSTGISIKDFLGVLNVTLLECILVNIVGNVLIVKYPLSKKPWSFALSIIVLFLSYLTYRYCTAYPDYVDVLKSYNGKQDRRSFSFFFFITTITFCIGCLVGFGLHAIKNSVQVERKARILEQQIGEARLLTLKYQINPHFLFNTLSYMYSEAKDCSDNLGKSILVLSDMMRYSLNKNDDLGLAPLEKEIIYIDNFIEIHRLRFENDFNVNFSIEGVIGNSKIAPLLLINFIENAFKHGIVTEPSKSLTIKLKINKNQLQFFIQNYKKISIKDQTSGIGLENTINRLDLLYPEKYTLEISDKPEIFTVDLNLILT